MLRAAPPTTPPRTCPFCKSGEITTTGKSVTDDQYWRCTTCGQIWNPARLPSFRQFG